MRHGNGREKEGPCDPGWSDWAVGVALQVPISLPGDGRVAAKAR